MSPNVRGCIYMTLGSVGYVINDAFIKASTDEGLGVYQALFLRGLVISTVFVIVARSSGVDIARHAQNPQVIRRALLETVSVAMFFGGLVHMKFANAQTILMVVPFAVTVIAAVVLKERVSTLRYVAVVAGFIGVLLVVRPEAGGFSIWSLVVVASAALLLIREFATRGIPNDVPAVAIALVTAVCVVMLMAVLSVVNRWGQPTGRGIAFLFGACGAVIAGYLFAILSVRTGDLSVTAPFRYMSLVASVIVGRIAFGETMDRTGLIGCAVIVVAGVASARLERRERRRAAVPPDLMVELGR